MDALAITDRGGLYGAIRFAKACLQAGIAPIVGVDLAVRPDLSDAASHPGDLNGGVVVVGAIEVEREADVPFDVHEALARATNANTTMPATRWVVTDPNLVVPVSTPASS